MAEPLRAEMQGKYRKNRRSIFKRILAIVVVIGLLAAGIAIGVNLSGNKSPKIDNAFIESKLAAASELTSARLTYNGLIKYSDGRIPYINEEAFSMIYRAEITAGIDMEQMESRVIKRKVVITIPESKVLDVDIEDDSIEFYDKKFALFKGDSKEDVIFAREAAAEDVLKEGNIEALLEEADKQNRIIIETLLSESIGDRELIINTK